MGCKYHRRLLSSNDIFNYTNLKNDTVAKLKFFEEWFGYKVETEDPIKKMNKGEHSEALFTLRLLEGNFINNVDNEEIHDPKIVFAHDALVWYENEALYIRNENEIRAYPAPNLHDLADAAEEEIRNGVGTFESPAAQWYYDALTENGISLKAPSSSKSDLFIRYENEFGEKRTVGISIKSMLGGSPSILNAGGRATAIAYEITGYDNLTDDELHEVKIDSVVNSVKAGTSTVSYSGIDSEAFTSIIDEAQLDKAALADVVWKWKIAAGNNRISTLADEKDVAAFKQFFKIIMTTATAGKMERSKRPPKFMGRIDNNGAVSLAPFEKVWEGLRLDAPSKTRHDYGYLYREDGKVKMRVAIGVRYTQ